MACYSRWTQVLATCDQDLRLTLETVPATLSVGDGIDVTFGLTNTGSTTLRACWGPTFEVVFSNGQVAQGWAEVVAHPRCEQRLVLEPGAHDSRLYRARVPHIPSGDFNLFGSVQIVDPSSCRKKYGCDRTMVRGLEPAGALVTIIK